MTTKRGKRRIQPKFGPLTIAGDEYSVRLNPPIRVFADLTSSDLDRIIPALGVLVAEHPFIEGEGDEETTLGVEQWPLDDVQAFVEAYGALMNALPPG